MRARLGKVLLFLASGIAAGISACAETPEAKACQDAWPEPFVHGQPFLLADPRSGLMLYVESDGRHMAAITHEGKVLWHRDLFSDPKLEKIFVPPLEMEGVPGPSAEEWQQETRSILSKLAIDRIGIASDCMAAVINHHMHPQFRGHYIRAWSGTWIMWLLDAESGDLLVEGMN